MKTPQIYGVLSCETIESIQSYHNINLVYDIEHDAKCFEFHLNFIIIVEKVTV